MSFKGIYKHSSFSSRLGILFALVLVSFLVHMVLAFALIYIVDEVGIFSIHNHVYVNGMPIYKLKIMQFFSAIGLFITPLLLYSFLTEFKFNFGVVKRQSLLLLVAIIIIGAPFINLLLDWNMKISMPEWILQLDNNSEELINAFLNINNYWDLVFTLIIMAIVPAIGEELFFRGWMQITFFKWLANNHFSIILTAFLFGLIHLDSQALIPRFVLGVLLGYLYYWSNNLWMPIIAHFLNNTQAVVFLSPFFKLENMLEPVLVGGTNHTVGIFSAIFVCILLYIFYKYNSVTKKHVNKEL